jgi:hypothetical protein
MSETASSRLITPTTTRMRASITVQAITTASA